MQNAVFQELIFQNQKLIQHLDQANCPESLLLQFFQRLRLSVQIQPLVQVRLKALTTSDRMLAHGLVG